MPNWVPEQGGWREDQGGTTWANLFVFLVLYLLLYFYLYHYHYTTSILRYVLTSPWINTPGE